ncbi:MAG: GFA family protein [Microcystaceae cyanobacterium]
MKELALPKTYAGGCHCGAVRFRVMITDFKAVDCNCSICRKKGFLHAIVPPEQFTLCQGEEFLSTYTFNTHQARHFFCRICGIHAFYAPRSHPGMIDVNVRCLDENVLSDFTIASFDGVNWEANIAQITRNAQDQ